MTAPRSIVVDSRPFLFKASVWALQWAVSLVYGRNRTASSSAPRQGAGRGGSAASSSSASATSAAPAAPSRAPAQAPTVVSLSLDTRVGACDDLLRRARRLSLLWWCRGAALLNGVPPEKAPKDVPKKACGRPARFHCAAADGKYPYDYNQQNRYLDRTIDFARLAARVCDEL